MKYRHFARLLLVLLLIYYLGMFLGATFLVLGLFLGTPFDQSGLPCFLGAVGTKIVFSFVVEFWLERTKGYNRGYPLSPEGLPVDPTGIRVDDESHLETGTMVLAAWEGAWFRAVIVEMKPNERVLLHFLGWDSFWDDTYPRKQLQMLADDAPIAPNKSAQQPGTSIQEKSADEAIRGYSQE